MASLRRAIRDRPCAVAANTDAGPLNQWDPVDGVGVGSMNTEYRPMCEGTSSVLMPDGINPALCGIMSDGTKSARLFLREPRSSCIPGLTLQMFFRIIKMMV